MLAPQSRHATTIIEKNTNHNKTNKQEFNGEGFSVENICCMLLPAS